jgi:prepilin peptidase CpaA
MFATYPATISKLAGIAFLLVAMTASITDLLRDKIYNWLTVPAFIAGLALNLYLGMNYFNGALAGVGVAAAIFLPLFIFKVMGAGDAKLVMALATVLGASATFELISISIVLSSLGAVVILVRKKRVREFFRQVYMFLRSLFVKGLEIQWPKLDQQSKAPFGIAIFFAYVVVWMKNGATI